MATPEGLSPPLFEAHPLSFSSPGLRQAAANLGLAILFFGSLAPDALHYGTGVANLIWAVGAALMGVLSLVRIPPNAARKFARLLRIVDQESPAWLISSTKRSNSTASSRVGKPYSRSW